MDREETIRRLYWLDRTIACPTVYAEIVDIGGRRFVARIPCCPYCKEEHVHGAMSGLRTPHCLDYNMRRPDYSLVLTDEDGNLVKTDKKFGEAMRSDDGELILLEDPENG